jgi:hypothetical protein
MIESRHYIGRHIDTIQADIRLGAISPSLARDTGFVIINFLPCYSLLLFPSWHTSRT